MPDHVQIPDRKPIIHLYGDGSKNEFPFDFPIFSADDLWVWLDEKRQTDGYEVRGINQSSGGSVVFTIPPSSGSRITLHRQLRFERTSDFPADAIIRAKAINDEFDYQTACLQQVLEELERCPQVSVTSNLSARLTWPRPKAGCAIGWSTDGKSLVNDPAQLGETVTAVKGYASAVKSAQDVTLASEQRTIAARDTAVRSETAAKESEQMAEKWAQTPEDEEVIRGEYSALHWAKKSEHFARNYPVATTEAAGIVELATVEEAKEGTDDQRAVTPAGVAAAFNRIASAEDTGIVKGGGNVDIAADGTLNARISLATSLIERMRLKTSGPVMIDRDIYAYILAVGGGGRGGHGGTAGGGGAGQLRWVGPIKIPAGTILNVAIGSSGGNTTVSCAALSLSLLAEKGEQGYGTNDPPPSGPNSRGGNGSAGGGSGQGGDGGSLGKDGGQSSVAQYKRGIAYLPDQFFPPFKIVVGEGGDGGTGGYAGGGGAGGVAANDNVVAANGTGSGPGFGGNGYGAGGGGSGGSGKGGNGAKGVVIIYEIIPVE